MPNIESEFRKRSIPLIKDNSNNTAPSKDEVEVVVPYQEEENRPEEVHRQEEAQPSITCDLASNSRKKEVEEGAVNRPQGTKPPLLGLEISLLGTIWISPLQAASQVTRS